MSSSDEGGQMMLLAAIVLLVAFLSLTTLVARVSVVEQETGRDVAPIVLRESEAVRRAVEALNATADVDALEFDDLLEELEEREGERGYFLEARCEPEPGDADDDGDTADPRTVQITISDARSYARFNVFATRFCD